MRTTITMARFDTLVERGHDNDMYLQMMFSKVKFLSNEIEYDSRQLKENAAQLADMATSNEAYLDAGSIAKLAQSIDTNCKLLDMLKDSFGAAVNKVAKDCAPELVG